MGTSVGIVAGSRLIDVHTCIYINGSPGVEIEHYSVAYFDRITAFEALYSVELSLRAGLIRTG